MKVHLIGSFLCAGLLVLVTSSGGYAASDKPKATAPGVQQSSAASNIKRAPGIKTTGGAPAPAAAKNLNSSRSN